MILYYQSRFCDSRYPIKKIASNTSITNKIINPKRVVKNSSGFKENAKAPNNMKPIKNKKFPL